MGHPVVSQCVANFRTGLLGKVGHFLFSQSLNKSFALRQRTSVQLFRTTTANMVIKLQKVLISDEVDAKCVNILQTNGVEVVKNTKLSKEELIAEIPVRMC